MRRAGLLDRFVTKPFAAALVVFATILVPASASAKVSQVSASGFAVRDLVEVSTSPEETWAVLLKPSVWWDPDHTWSGDAANLSLDARAGGCFCEVLPGAAAKASARGSVEHMRVVYIERPRALRMVGALGPLQGEGVSAALTIQLKADGKGGTQVLLEYVVGGYARTPFEKLAPTVDGVLAAQVQRLVEKLGGTFSAAFPAPASDASTAAPVEPMVVPETVEAAQPAGGIVPLADVPPPADGKVVGR